jgi:Mitochondrial carrier protein
LDVAWLHPEKGYAQGKRLVYALTPGRESPKFTLTEYGIAGAFSALPTTAVAAPVERIKVVLQVRCFCRELCVWQFIISADWVCVCVCAWSQTDSAGRYKGPIDAIRQLYLEGGMKSIYRGTLATVARDAPGSAACVMRQRPSSFQTIRVLMEDAGLFFFLYAVISSRKLRKRSALGEEKGKPGRAKI